MVDITRELARYLVAPQVDLPLHVRHEGARAFVNWLGCVLGGCRDTTVVRTMAGISEFAGPPQATVVGWGKQLDAPNAALVNTVSNFVNTYNDTHLATVAHPHGAVVASALAMAERRPIAGPRFVHAVVLGTEIACRISNVIAAPPARCHVGLSTGSLSSVFGAATTTGILLDLNEEQMVWALGIAAVQAGGIRSVQASMASHVMPGLAARDGMVAAFLAASGVTCSEAAIESSKGLVALLANPPNLAAATDGLGVRFEMLANTYKPYPSGIVIHPIIDACLDVAASPDFDPTAVDSVELRVNPLAISLSDRPEPKRRGEALLSAQHWAAVSLLQRKAGLEQVSAAAVEDPAVAAIRRRVRIESDSNLASDAASVVVRLANGRSLAASIEHCRGSLSRPMTDRELDEKFRSQSLGVLSPDQVEDLLADSWQVGSYHDVGALARELLKTHVPVHQGGPA